jgi:thiol:disulfide interchange protein
MKKIGLLLFLVGIFMVLKPTPSAAVKLQADTLVSVDDVTFSAGDSATTTATTNTVKSPVGVADKYVATAAVAGKPTSLWVTFLLGLIAGITAFFLPCIYPMVPLTISFFTKRAETKGKGIQGAVLYGLSIILIYVAIGTIITLIFGGSALNQLSTNGFFNVFIFLILVIFGISFLGAFEITLPSSFVNKLDSKSDSKGLTGIFFMAATLTVVSFSCTGPLIGGFLIGIEKDLLTPIVAMFGFSLALASIFTILAIFPSWLTSLPKSGGWLNSVKVVLGFLEIAFALKFLSTADLSYHWGILDREVFISIWMVISILLGLYILGKIKFSHDSDLPYISIPRITIAGAAFVFALYLLPGLFGAPLKAISGLLPPMSTQDFVLSQSGTGVAAPSAPAGSAKRKYSDFLNFEYKVTDGFFDYEEALAYAKTKNKPLFLDFTGHGCVNCREMEAKVLSDPRVIKKINDNFIPVAIYTDDKTALPVNEQFKSDILKTDVNTVGLKFQHLQGLRYKTLAQPYYALVGNDGNDLVSPPIGVEYDIDKYLAYLDQGINEFAKRNK